MNLPTTSTLLTLEEVKEHFEHWRKTQTRQG
ncbi:Uncharacterised protein [Legionella geestiana]|nr:Uncharacterised protein [Legionella geestiana]